MAITIAGHHDTISHRPDSYRLNIGVVDDSAGHYRMPELISRIVEEGSACCQGTTPNQLAIAIFSVKRYKKLSSCTPQPSLGVCR
jgi:hypothetical protein